MKKLLLAFVCLFVSLSAHAVSVGGVPVLPIITSTATNIGLYASSIYTTNLVPQLSPVTVIGSTVSGINGTYTLQVSNSAAQVQMIWTNGASSKLMEYRSVDTTEFGGHYAVEDSTNDFAGAAIWLSRTATYPVGLWDDAQGSDTVTSTVSTNSVVTAFQLASFTNAYFIATPTTNVTVDCYNGNDTVASIGTSSNRVPYATFAAACNAMIGTTNGVINVVNGVYTSLGGNANIPKGVTVNFNGATIHEPVTITDGDVLNGPAYFTLAPHYNVTNANSVTITRNIISRGPSGDGILIDGANGTMQWWDCDMGSGWDACIINRTFTNALMQFNNCRFPAIRGLTDDLSVTWGFHSMLWRIAATNGGTLELNNCRFDCLNSTNIAFTGTDPGNMNTCIGIVPYIAGVTTFNNAQIKINGVTLNYGSTNSGVITTGISNVLNIPISGGPIIENQIYGLITTPPTNSFSTIKSNAIVESKLTIATVSVFTGSGSPEGAITAPIGSLYLRTDGSTSTTLYVKTSGTGNTGWTAK